jgi:hypothetical protein
MKNQRANTLLVVLMVTGVLSMAVLCAVNLTANLSRNVARTNTYRSAVSIGDGAIDHLFAHWRERCRPQQSINYKGEDFASLPVPTATFFPNVENFAATAASDRTKTVSNLRIRALDYNWKTIADNAVLQPVTGMSLGTSTFYYLASADVTLPGKFGASVQANVRRVLEKQIISPWNYAIFYMDRLEIHPGPQFNITGWVHTNERLYTGHNTLSFQSKVTYAEDWYTGFAPGDGSHQGETPTAPGTAANLPPALEQAHQPFGLDSSRIFPSGDSNPNNDSYRELIERPVSGYTDSIADARYYNQADVRLIVTNNGSGNPVLSILNKLDQSCTSASTGRDKDLYDVFTDAVTLGQKIQDNREAAEIRLVTLDMAKINTALRSGGKLYNKAFTGVIYATDTTATTSARRGIRLKNGGTMPPGGLTVATDNPLYVQGDYNTGTAGSTQPNSNASNGDPTKNTVAGYARQPCAVLADAVMLLSNAWTDANSYQTLASRDATPTTYNLAIVSGVVPTGTSGTNYSGGAENFPRFIESWGSTTTVTYWGSLVQLFTSKQNTGLWGKSNVYDAPRRMWYYDTLFFTNPPPGTLTLISYNKGRWYLE